ncbi:MAG: flippase-like domain-containing protein [Chloroflexi bacterium]|nr:flippase-like domain-containing protein [Chloroflexota bacterium]
MKAKFVPLAKITLTVVLLGWVVSRTGVENLVDTLTQDVNFSYLLVAFVLFQIGLVMRTIRWNMFLVNHNVRLPFQRLVLLNYSAAFFGTFLPTSFGGDIVRATELNSGNLSVSHSGGIVLLDRLIGLMALFTICLVALIPGHRQLPSSTILTLVLVCTGGLLAGFVIVQGRVLTALLELFNIPGIQILRNINLAVTETSYQIMFQTWLLSLGYNAMIVTEHFIISQAFQADVTILHFAMFTPIVALGLLVPVIQGIGVREEIYRNLLLQVGVPAAVGVSIGLGAYGVTLLTGLLGGLIYVGYTMTNRGQISDTSPAR